MFQQVKKTRLKKFEKIFAVLNQKEEFCRFLVKFLCKKVNLQTIDGKRAVALVEQCLRGEKVTEKQLRVAGYNSSLAHEWNGYYLTLATRMFLALDYVNVIVWMNTIHESKEYQEFFRQIALNFLCYQKQQWDFNQKQWKILLIQGLNDNDADLINISLRDFPEDEEFTTSFIKDIRRFYSTKEDIVPFLLKKKDEVILLLEEIF